MGGSEVKWSFKGSCGRLRGLLILWKEGTFVLSFNFSGEGFMGIIGVLKGLNMYVVNIYSSLFIHKKRKLWKELSNCKSKFPVKESCVRGDFNVIRYQGEMKYSSHYQNSLEMEEFNEFFEKRKVVDLMVVWRKFTWFGLDGRAMSCLDRFLLT